MTKLGTRCKLAIMWTTELIGQIDLVSGWLKNDSHNDDIAVKLKLVSGELAKLDVEAPLPDFELIEKLNTSQFNNMVAEQTKAHLEALLLNIESKKFYRYTANGIMQKAAPVYKESDFTYGRTHFLAPHKVVFSSFQDLLPPLHSLLLRELYLYLSNNREVPFLPF